MTEWQQIGEVPIDSGRLVLCDPVNFADVDRHDRELERDPELYDRSPDYELIGNELGVPVAVLLATGIGDGRYAVEARFEEAVGAVRVAEIRMQFL